MSVITLPIPEEQVIEWTTCLSPKGKRQVLWTLIPEMARFETLVDYGSERIQALCATRGLDWNELSEDERERLVDDILAINDPGYGRIVYRQDGKNCRDDRRMMKQL